MLQYFEFKVISVSPFSLTNSRWWTASRVTRQSAAQGYGNFGTPIQFGGANCSPTPVPWEAGGI